jgi:hypothetical protein
MLLWILFNLSRKEFCQENGNDWLAFRQCTAASQKNDSLISPIERV